MFQNRCAFFGKAKESLTTVYEDKFVKQMLVEEEAVCKKEVEFFQKSQEPLVDKPLGDLIQYLVGFNQEKMDTEARNLNRGLSLNEQLYFSHVIKGYGDKALWPEIQKIIKVKHPPVPFATIAELLYAAGNREVAAETFCKVPDKE